MREELIAATRNLLRSKGLAAVSTRAIAREAGCAEGTLYNHFTTVGELLLAVFMQSLPQFFVLGSSTLRSIVLARPRTVAQLQSINGIGPDKAAKFGSSIVELCNA